MSTPAPHPGPAYSPDGRYWWDGHRWLPTASPPAPEPVRLNVSIPPWLHWLIPAAMIACGIFLLSSVPAARGPFGIATDQSIGDTVVGVSCIAMALGYGLGRGVARLQRRSSER